MNNNIVIEIPAIKKEVLRITTYCRVSTAYEESANIKWGIQRSLKRHKNGNRKVWMEHINH